MSGESPARTEHGTSIAGAVLFVVGFTLLPLGFVVGPTIASTDLPFEMASMAYVVTAFTLIIAGGWISNQHQPEGVTDA